MEDVLDLYAEPYDPERPVVCFDETSTQLLADINAAHPGETGEAMRQDYEYLRRGTRNLFLTCEPRAGCAMWRLPNGAPCRTSPIRLQWLVGRGISRYPCGPAGARQLEHTSDGFPHETFPAAEARRITKRLEFHHTPKHGSWLKYG